MKCLACCLLPLLLAGCDAKEFAERAQRAEASAAACKASTEALQQKVQFLEAKVQELSQTPDALWQDALARKQADDYAGALAALEAFAQRFPTDPRTPAALPKAKREIQQAKDRVEMAEKLRTVTVQQIVAKPQAYAGSVFRRRICCSRIEYSQYGVPTGLVEMNWRAGKRHCSRAREAAVACPRPVAVRAGAA